MPYKDPESPAAKASRRRREKRYAGLGRFGEDAARLRLAADYLEKTS